MCVCLRKWCHASGIPWTGVARISRLFYSVQIYIVGVFRWIIYTIIRRRCLTIAGGSNLIEFDNYYLTWCYIFAKLFYHACVDVSTDRFVHASEQRRTSFWRWSVTFDATARDCLAASACAHAVMECAKEESEIIYCQEFGWPRARIM